MQNGLATLKTVRWFLIKLNSHLHVTQKSHSRYLLLGEIKLVYTKTYVNVYSSSIHDHQTPEETNVLQQGNEQTNHVVPIWGNTPQNELLINLATWTKWKGIMLSKISHSQRLIYRMCPFTWHSQNDNIIETEQKSSSRQGTGRWKYDHKEATRECFLIMKLWWILTVVLIPPCVKIHGMVW